MEGYVSDQKLCEMIRDQKSTNVLLFSEDQKLMGNSKQLGCSAKKAPAGPATLVFQQNKIKHSSD